MKINQGFTILIFFCILICLNYKKATALKGLTSSLPLMCIDAKQKKFIKKNVKNLILVLLIQLL